LNRTKTLLVAIALAVPVPAAIAGCGGDDSSSEDPADVLQATFNNDTKIESGVLDLNLDVAADGDQGGSLTVNVSGPFAMNPDDPQGIGQLDLDITATGDGSIGAAVQDFQAGVTVTADNLYVNYGGTDYQLGSDQFQQLKDQAESTAGDTSGDAASSFKEGCVSAIEAQGGDAAACDFDVTGWFTDLSNDGTEDKGGAETTHVSGGLNVQQMVNDLFQLGASVPGATGGTDPATIEPFLGVISDAVSEASFDVYSATEDDTLRGFDFSLGIDPSAIPGAAATAGDLGTATLDLSLEISDVGAEQTFTAPENPKSIDDLAQQFGGLGAIPGATPTVPGGSGTGSIDPDCIANAQGDANEIEKCLQ
jgi:hypothetical protein